MLSGGIERGQWHKMSYADFTYGDLRSNAGFLVSSYYKFKILTILN